MEAIYLYQRVVHTKISLPQISKFVLDQKFHQKYFLNECPGLFWICLVKKLGSYLYEIKTENATLEFLKISSGINREIAESEILGNYVVIYSFWSFTFSCVNFK